MSEGSAAVRVVLKERLRSVLDDEASLWRTRAKQHWLRGGDNNTKFYHSIANGRRRANMIGVLNDNGRLYQSEDDKKDHFYQYFKERYSTEATAPHTFGDWSMLFSSNRVSESLRRRLSEKFSVEEIKEAVFQLGRDKALGPDGFPLSFYQTFWEMIKGRPPQPVSRVIRGRDLH